MMNHIAQAGSFFANGAGLFYAGALAVSVPVVIHLLTRLQRVTLPWGAMRFLLEVYRRHRTRLQLEQWILLAIRCLLLALLGMALAGPQPSGVAKGLGLKATSRTMCLVIDDSLSASAQLGAEARFEKLRALALDMVDKRGPTDRVAIWSAAMSPQELMVPASMDRAAAQAILEGMRPRYTRSDLAGALRMVGEELASKDLSADQTFVILLSDFSADALPTDAGGAAGAAAALARIGEHARVLATHPAEPLANVQIEQLQPRRHLVVVAPDQAPATVPLELKLRRYVTEAATQSTTVDVSLYFGSGGAAEGSLDGRATGAAAARAVPVTTVRRELRWSPGQDVAVMSLDLPLDSAADALGGDWLNDQAGATSGRRAVIEAKIGDDALTADNSRAAIVELRRQLNVAVIDAAALPEPAEGATGDLSARQWLTLALRVGGNAVREMPANDIDRKALAHVDAVLLLRPDLIDAGDAAAVRQVAERGGLVWVTVPAEPADAQWAERFTKAMNLPWEMGIDPQRSDNAAANAGGAAGANGGAAEAESKPDAAATPQSLGVALNTDTAVPEALNLLATDWQELLRPIRVRQWIELSVKPGGGGDETIWLRTTQGKPVLAAAPVGSGLVLMLTTAVDTRWTNLPTKPLFVPLVNEALRGVLGTMGEARRLSDVTCGAQPVLDREWEGAQYLLRESGVGIGALDRSGPTPSGEPTGESPPAAQPSAQPSPPPSAQDDNKVALLRTDAGFMPVSPLALPGVYSAAPTPATGPRRLAVNVDAEAGNTRAVDEGRLRDWLTNLGAWKWLNEDDPMLSLQVDVSRTNLGPYLLWIVMCLAVLELFLARFFSHAKNEPAIEPRFNRILGQVVAEHTTAKAEGARA